MFQTITLVKKNKWAFIFKEICCINFKPATLISVLIVKQLASARTGVLSGITPTKTLSSHLFANTWDASKYKEFINTDDER